MLKSRYGINAVERDWMLFLQEYECAIDGCTNMPEVVDHCHTTGKVRQMLCHGCNTKLGALESDLLPSLIKYAYKHASQITTGSKETGPV